LSSFDQIGQGVLGTTSDYFIISAIGNQHLVGLFSFAIKISRMVYRVIPLKEFTKIIRPLYFQKFIRKDYQVKELTQINTFMLKLLLPIYFIPFVFFLIFGKDLILLVYGQKYVAAYIPACIMFAAPILNSIGTPLSLIIKLHEKMEYFLYTKIIVVFSIVLGIVFMKLWGIIGVVIATTACSFLKWCIMLIFIRRTVPVYFRFKELLNYLYVSIFIFTLFSLMQPLINNVYSIILFIVLFIILYGILLINYHPFSTEDLILLKKFSGSSKILNKCEPIILKINNLKPAISKLISNKLLN